jgi:hypothetical protein
MGCQKIWRCLTGAEERGLHPFSALFLDSPRFLRYYGVLAAPFR